MTTGVCWLFHNMLQLLSLVKIITFWPLVKFSQSLTSAESNPYFMIYWRPYLPGKVIVTSTMLFLLTLLSFFSFVWLSLINILKFSSNQLLHPNIGMQILHAVLSRFPKVLTRRICLTIKSFFSWWSFPLFSWLNCLIQGWYCREK